MQLNPTSDSVNLLKRYVDRLFQAFIDFTATATDFELLLEAAPGTIDEDLHSYLCQYTALQIAEMLHASSLGLRQELARRTWNFCVEANRRQIDPDTWYAKLPVSTQSQIHVELRVKGLKVQVKQAFALMSESIVRNKNGTPAEAIAVSLELQRNYIELRGEYQRAFDRMWFGLLTASDPNSAEASTHLRRP